MPERQPFCFYSEGVHGESSNQLVEDARQSPDLNPIENLWHEMKEFNRREVKPRMKEQLIDGIIRFWDTVTVAKCVKYINHLQKVIPRVIELNGYATGY